MEKTTPKLNIAKHSLGKNIGGELLSFWVRVIFQGRAVKLPGSTLQADSISQLSKTTFSGDMLVARRVTSVPSN